VNNGIILSDTWSLGLANNFDLTNPPWSNVSYNGDFRPTPAAFNVMVSLPDSVSFLINGGLSTPLNKFEVNQTTVFNTFTHQWTTINSSTLTQTRQHSAAIDANGRVWYWGGFRYDNIIRSQFSLPTSLTLSNRL
jgi:hypothetical protein